MLDIVNLSNKITIECNLDELPVVLAERVNLHLMQEEKIQSCVVTRSDERVWVQAITPYRIMVSTLDVEKGNIIIDPNHKNVSLLLSDFSALSLKEYSPYKEKYRVYELDVISASGHIELRFYNKEILHKFSNAIVSFAHQNKQF